MKKSTDEDLTGFSHRKTDWWKFSLQLRGCPSRISKQTLNAWIPSPRAITSKHRVGSAHRVRHVVKRFSQPRRWITPISQARKPRREEPAQGHQLGELWDRGANVYPEACAQLPAHPQRMPEGGELRSTWSGPGKPSAAVPTPEAGGKSQQDGTRRGATVRDLRGPVSRGLPAQRGREESASNGPDPRDSLRLAATAGERKRYSPAKTAPPIAADWTREPGQPGRRRQMAPSTADTARPAPAAGRLRRLRRPA